ncbi:hypothetical protein WICPIJ_003616 [Wickerhamomyces pijperi]|uniref:mRNA-capping enzyme subunit beta n=1 Tax=Wickerhamomyces pijperi TaxID=599730 RepID=A0A9P8Q6T6_WICPI|nr:hypothetical protein WICPIJ_003616 [Wickerhamomyces pijperi]
MDLKNLVAPTSSGDKEPVSPDFQHRAPSIINLVNPPSSSEGGATSNANFNSTSNRPSITSITNDNDVDVNGNKTPSMARKMSHHSLDNAMSDNEAPPPVRRQPSLADMLGSMGNASEDEIEEPKYEDEHEDPKPITVTDKKDEESKEDKAEPIPEASKPETTDLKRPLETDTTTPEESSEPKRQQTQTTNKPKKYDQPPIWAQKWVSKTAKIRRFQSNIPANATAVASQKDPNVSSLGGLYSIKGVRPYNDIARRISQWIYVNLNNTRQEDREHLELEIKLGRIIDPRTTKRINIPVVSECVLSEDFSVGSRFEAGLEEHEWKKLKKYISDMMALDKKKFKSLQSDTVDQQFRDATPGHLPRKFRVSRDSKTSRVMEVIEKKRIASLFVHCPDLACDFRLSLSLESPFPRDFADKFQDKSAENERAKKRLSIDHELTNTRFDITEVVQKEKNGKQVKLFEFELEVHMKVLLAAFDALNQDNDNNMPFQEVPDILMDNARILNRYLSK